MLQKPQSFFVGLKKFYKKLFKEMQKQNSKKIAPKMAQDEIKNNSIQI
jgi:hypothetical protein